MVFFAFWSPCTCSGLCSDVSFPPCAMHLIGTDSTAEVGHNGSILWTPRLGMQLDFSCLAACRKQVGCLVVWFDPVHPCTSHSVIPCICDRVADCIFVVVHTQIAVKSIIPEGTISCARSNSSSCRLLNMDRTDQSCSECQKDGTACIFDPSAA